MNADCATELSVRAMTLGSLGSNAPDASARPMAPPTPPPPEEACRAFLSFSRRATSLKESLRTEPHAEGRDQRGLRARAAFLGWLKLWWVGTVKRRGRRRRW